MTDVDFGYKKVAREEKTRLVRGVFESVAENYDLMDDVMSFGTHRLFKRMTLEMSGVRRGHKVLDLASGTGDLAARFSGLVGAEGQVVMSDINAAMLQQGRSRMLDDGHVGNIAYAQINAQLLPFPDNTFDCITIGFGLRNVTDKQQALESIYRALKPGGRLLVLEFSHPTSKPLQTLYDIYSFKLLPKIGKIVTDDEDSYRYLAESIRMHPDQETLKDMLSQAGFENCDYHNLTGGIVAVHRGFKF